MNRQITTSLFAMLLPLFATACLATDTVELQIISESSSINANLNLQAHLPGSLIGNFDAKTNPGGTMTRPGLFGGQGNLPVDLDITGILSGDIDAQPMGGYRLELDLVGLAVTISEFELDLLGGETGVLPLLLDLEFETFRTFQPNSLFPGVPITLPLGDGSLTVLTLQQTGPAPPVQLIPQGSNLYSFTLLVPVEIELESEFFGQPVNPGALPSAIVLTGELEVDGSEVTVSQTFAQMASDEITDIPGGDFTDLPLDLPTVFPPGETAHLLLSGTLDSISVEIALNAILTAEGQISDFILGDINGDGVVSLLDVQPFVDVLVSGAFQPEADLNQDGSVDPLDVQPFVDLLAGN